MNDGPAPSDAPGAGPQLRGALRAATPLLIGQAVIFGAGFLQRPALLFFLEPADFAAFGLLNEALRWAVVLGGLGLATGLLRLAPEHPRHRGALLRTNVLAVLVSGLAVFSVVMLLRPIVFGDGPAASEFATFGWKIPCIAMAVVALNSLHAAGRLRAKAVLDSGDKVLVLWGAVAGAAVDGLRGLVTGSLIASAISAFVILRFASRDAGPSERPTRELLGRTFTIGRSYLLFMLVETFRRLVVLRISDERGAGPEETGHLYAAMSLTLPLIAWGEVVAQATYPRMLGEGGERGDLDASQRRMLGELTLLSLPLLALYGAGLYVLLPLIKDGAYTGSVAPALALLPGVAAHGLAAHSNYMLLVRHRLSRAVWVSVVALCVAVPTAWFLIPALGATGGATAVSAALIVRGALLYAIARGRPTPA